MRIQKHHVLGTLAALALIVLLALEALSYGAATIFNEVAAHQDMLRGSVRVEKLFAHINGHVRFEGLVWSDEAGNPVLIVPEGDNVLDVAPIVYDTVALCIPLQHVHAEGECDEATWQALQAHTAHGIDDELQEYGSYADDDSAAEDIDNETNIDPRWAELMKLKDNKLKNK